MSKFNWPPKKTFSYEFRENEELNLVINLIDNSIDMKKNVEKDKYMGE